MAIQTNNTCCGNEAGLVQKFIGTAYDVVKTVYENLGEIQFIYDFLHKYGVLITIDSIEALKALPTDAKYTRVYSYSSTLGYSYTDYLYVDGNVSGIIPNDPNATGSWIVVATSGQGGSSGSGGYIPLVYNQGSAVGGETTIAVPPDTTGVPFIVIEGLVQYVGYGFTYDVATLTITLAQPLEAGDEVVLLLSGTPAVPDNPNIDDWVIINWLYNHGAAIGGEQVIAIPYTFQSIPAVFKNGLRYYQGLATESYTVDAPNQRIILTEPLVTNDRLIVQIGGESVVLEMSDRTLQEVARSTNFRDSEVIMGSDTTQVLNGKKIVYDEVAQKSYGLPVLPTNVYIVSVGNGKLTYSPGNVVVDLLPVPNSAESLEKDLAKNTGAQLVGWKRTILADAVTNVDRMLSAQSVNVWEYANLVTVKPTPADPNTWDWTPAFQAAISYLDSGGLNPGKSGGCIFIPAMVKNMVYRVTELIIPLSVCIYAQGVTVAPFNYAETHTHLLKFMGMNKVTGLQISMEYSVTYGAAIWCRGRNIDFVSCGVWFSSNSVQIGEISWATDPLNSWLGDSEISFTNCQFNWCLKTCTAYGLNTILTFGGGSRCYSNPGSIPSGHPNEAAWLAAPRGNFHNYGALIYVVGAFIGTFTRDVPSMTSYPVNTTVTDYLPTYGRYVVDGTHVETSFLFYAPAPSGFTVTDDATTALFVSNAQGHVATSLTDLYWINASASMKQKIFIAPSVSFYGSAGVVPTRAKLISAPGCLVDIPFQASCFPCITGEIKDACNILYPVNKDNLQLVTAFGSAQAVTTSATTLIMPSFGTIDLIAGARATYYAVATGLFTAAVEMHDVEVTIDLRYVTPSSTNNTTLNLVVSGATVDTVVASGAYSRVTLKARRIAKGATFLVNMVGSAAYTLDGTANTKLSMTASV